MTNQSTQSNAPALSSHDGPWHKDGLHFTCTRCGNCCTGAPGYVWVTPEEISQIAELRRESVDDTARRFVRQVGQRFSLTERPNGDCSFYDRENRGCSIYSARPRQCRSWPFWDSNLESPETWRATCKVCPGSGRGDFVPLEEIQRRAALIQI